LTNKTILVTGAAGFIGSNLVMELLKTVEPVTIVGLDNMNDYYDVSIKEYRLEQINKLAAEHPVSRWEFIKGNTFGAVAFTSYGAFWLSFWAFVQFFEKSVPKADAGHAVGLFLIAWGIFTAYMFIASLRTTAAVALVFILLAVTFFLLGIGNAGAHTNIIKAGGWVGLATAAAAWYASFAAVTNSTFGRIIMPVRPLNR
jgi:succinate-acetate transporter protein